MTAPVAWLDIRDRISTAVLAALGANADAWKVTKYIPLTPDDPAIWVNWPSSMERASMQGHYSYVVPVSFCVGLHDTDLAQELIDEVYADSFYRTLRTELVTAGLENAVASPPAEPPRQIDTSGTGGESLMLVVDVVIEVPST